MVFEWEEMEVDTPMEVQDHHEEMKMEVTETSLGKYEVFQLGIFTGSICILLEEEVPIVKLSNLLGHFKNYVLYPLLLKATPVNKWLASENNIRKKINETGMKDGKIRIRLIINFYSIVSTFHEIEEAAINFVDHVALNIDHL